MSEVVYLPVVGFHGYRVGSDGSVWSNRPRTGKGPFTEWRSLSLHADKRSGYLKVDLHDGKKRFNRYVHRLVAEAFLGKCPEGMECCHGPDTNRSNNSPGNLRWDTHRNNLFDREKTGTVPRGDSHYATKIKDSDVVLARSMCESGSSIKEIANRFGVERSTVCQILNRTKRRSVK